jgi:predicted enzyme related to lactoylglutathione lyase
VGVLVAVESDDGGNRGGNDNATGDLRDILLCTISPVESLYQAMNPVSYFEIPVADLDRAVDFYRAVFAHDFERMQIDGNDMALFPHVEGAAGASGALAKGESHVPGSAGARVFFTVSNIQSTLSRALAAGGKVPYPETAVGSFGFVAEIEDSEGNRIALYAESAS